MRNLNNSSSSNSMKKSNLSLTGEESEINAFAVVMQRERVIFTYTNTYIYELGIRLLFAISGRRRERSNFSNTLDTRGRRLIGLQDGSALGGFQALR
jgi:hypothetical protein